MPAVGLLVSSAHFTESAAQSSSLDKQEQCAAIARRTPLDEFKAEFEYTTDKSLFDTTVDIGHHESHYSSKRDKCFLFFSDVNTVKGVINDTTSEWYLIDAIEKRYLAQFGIRHKLEMHLGQATGKYVDQTYCELAPSGQKKIECSNRAEFDAFVATYMGE